MVDNKDFDKLLEIGENLKGIDMEELGKAFEDG